MTTMSRQIFVSADNPDVLSGTDLDEMPFAGTLILYGASTQNDTGVTVTAPSFGPMGVGAPLRVGPMKLRGNAEIRTNEDPPMAIFPIAAGQHATVNIDVVTAATASVLAVLTDGSS